jgi:O-acetyl-ADP-ribose deacetylase (regulator of RNase III)
MTFTEIKGNLFDRELEHPREYYVHCISRDYACGAGIAKEFNKKYNLSLRLLDLPRTSCMIIDDVISLVTKSKYWQKPTYDSLRRALFDLKELCEESLLNVKTLVMPRIGCGLDKLQWNNVKKMLKEIFEDTDVAIEVYYL